MITLYSFCLFATLVFRLSQSTIASDLIFVAPVFFLTHTRTHWKIESIFEVLHTAHDVVDGAILRTGTGEVGQLIQTLLSLAHIPM